MKLSGPRKRRLPALPRQDDDVMGTINTTPLVDVMLVLLIIFLIAIPVVRTSVKVDLPRQTLERMEPQPQTVVISVDRDGRIFLGDQMLSDARALRSKLQGLASRKPQPPLEIRGDSQASYAQVGQVLAVVQGLGLDRVGLATEPARH